MAISMPIPGEEKELPAADESQGVLLLLLGKAQGAKVLVEVQHASLLVGMLAAIGMPG